MNIIIPMAGMGKRLRPHTLTVPKPLLKVAGKPIVEWIIYELEKSSDAKIDEIHYVVGNFGKDVENKLVAIAAKVGAKGFIHYQHEALGTAHAIHCAADGLKGPAIIAFADTLFHGNLNVDDTDEGIIWTMRVKNPEQYGVVVTNDDNIIQQFVEKPKQRISENAIIGIYYFKDSSLLASEIKHLIDNNLRENNEFQLTNCLETLRQKGLGIRCKEVTEWLDCGNRNELLNTNARMIAIKELGNADSSYVEQDVTISNSTVRNNSSVYNGTTIENSVLDNCIIYENCQIKNATLTNAIIGSNSSIDGLIGEADLSEYSRYEKI